jgi:23S rRNA (uridine2552-2'-O)-methyltransferase
MTRGSSGRSGKNPYAKPDAFAQRAKKEGYPARSVYKLEEIDRRVRLLRPGMHVLDLGCAPGSWLLYAAQKVAPSGRARGIDLTPLEISLPRNAEAMVGDAFTPTAEVDAFIRELSPYHVVLSDMAPSTTGDRFRDQMRSADLVDRTLDLADELVAPGGAWVAKVFMSDELPRLRGRVRALFETERIIRPEGTRAVSYEVFLVGEKRKARANPG